MATLMEARQPGQMMRYEKPKIKDSLKRIKCPHCGAPGAIVETYHQLTEGKRIPMEIVRCNQQNTVRWNGDKVKDACGYKHKKNLETGETIVIIREKRHKWKGRENMDTLTEKKIPGNGKSSGLIQPKSAEVVEKAEEILKETEELDWDKHFDEIEEMHKNKVPWKIIAEKYGTNKHTLCAAFSKKKQDKKNGVHCKRVKHYQKWTEEEFQKMCDMKENGVAWVDIAKHYGVTYSGITSAYSVLKLKYGREPQPAKVNEKILTGTDNPPLRPILPTPEPEPEFKPESIKTNLVPTNLEEIVSSIPGNIIRNWEEMFRQNVNGFQQGWEARGRDMQGTIAAIKQRAVMKAELAALESRRDYLFESLEKITFDYYAQIRNVGEDITKLTAKIRLFDETQKLEV